MSILDRERPRRRHRPTMAEIQALAARGDPLSSLQPAPAPAPTPAPVPAPAPTPTPTQTPTPDTLGPIDDLDLLDDWSTPSRICADAPGAQLCNKHTHAGQNACRDFWWEDKQGLLRCVDCWNDSPPPRSLVNRFWGLVNVDGHLTWITIPGDTTWHWRDKHAEAEAARVEKELAEFA